MNGNFRTRPLGHVRPVKIQISLRMRRLILFFTGGIIVSQRCNVSSRKHERLWLDWFDLSLRWTHMSEGTFSDVVTYLWNLKMSVRPVCKNIERISKLQKRAARIILRANYDTPSVDMFSQLGWLSIPDRLKYNKAVLTYRAINNLSPEYITQLLKPVSEVHTLNLRSSENGSLYVPKARTALFDGSFSCSAPRLWNALPQTVKTSGSLSTFKQSLKATF